MKDVVIGEGTHFMIPWVQMPIIFDIRARPKNVPTITGKIRIWVVKNLISICNDKKFETNENCSNYIFKKYEKICEYRSSSSKLG